MKREVRVLGSRTKGEERGQGNRVEGMSKEEKSCGHVVSAKDAPTAVLILQQSLGSKA